MLEATFQRRKPRRLARPGSGPGRAGFTLIELLVTAPRDAASRVASEIAQRQCTWRNEAGV
jgi:hypothetical protein